MQEVWSGGTLLQVQFLQRYFKSSSTMRVEESDLPSDYEDNYSSGDKTVKRVEEEEVSSSTI